VKVKVLRSAIDDLIDGRRFYDLQGNNLGDYFFNTLFSEIDSLVFYAGIHSKSQGYHKNLSSTFPYAIYYQIIDNEAVVFRVLDCRQDSRKIRSKLRNC
jgi:plasmid stabilization system protein ParE